MAIKVLNLDKEWEFRSKHDPDNENENATVFVLGTLSSRMIASLQDGASKWRQSPDGKDGIEADFLPNTMSYEVVRFGLKGAKNLVDEDGANVPFETAKRASLGETATVVAERILKCIPLDVIRELAEEIQSKNVLSEDDAKN